MSAAGILTLVLIAAAAVSAVAAAMARSLVAMCLYLWVTAALAAAALLAQGDIASALGLALFGGGLAPVIVLATILLSARAVKSTRVGAPWITCVCAAAIGGAVFWIVPDVPSAPQVATPEASDTMLLAACVVVAIAAVAGLLGFGPRGVLDHPSNTEADL